LPTKGVLFQHDRQLCIIFQFTDAQVEWLENQQISIDNQSHELQARYIQLGYSIHENGGGNHISNWEGHAFLQSKLDSKVQDMKILKEAVSNVKACWDAIRCCSGLGMTFNLTLFQLCI
jgi:hypothetical protein